jgi:poly-gamma-glutamate system protein
LKYQPGKVHAASLVALAAVGLLLLYAVERAKAPVMQPHFVEKMEAATRAQLAMKAIKEARLAGGVPIDPVNDPNETGLVGLGFSLITTDRGSPEQKIRALDPNLAAVFVEMLTRARVEAGNHVAIAMTGAFPLLNASAIIAVEAVGAVPVSITSVGSSMWGANDPDFTWLDMEAVLLREGVISHRSVAASRGGGDDGGRGLTPEGRALVDTAIVRSGAIPIVERSLDASIRRRMQIYADAGGKDGYAAYINVGGGLASLGSEQVGQLVRPGLSRRLEERNFPRRGTLVRMAQGGVPIIHVPGPDALIERYGLSASPTPTPAPGTGDVFYQDRYNVPLAGTVAVLYGFLIFAVVRLDLKHYVFRRVRRGEGSR